MRVFLCVLMLCCSVLSLAQQKRRRISLEDSLERAQYISSNRNFLTLYVYGSRTSNAVWYRGNSNLTYFPITPVNIGIGASHKWLGGSVSIVSINSSKSKFIDNYNFSIMLNGYARKIGVDIGYTINSGYYQANYDHFRSFRGQGEGDPYVDMRIQRFVLNFVRIFNYKKYSLNAPIVQGEMQLKNASSFLLNLGVSTAYAKNGDSSFVPTYLENVFHGNAQLVKGRFYCLDIMPGYGMNFVIKKRFFVGIVPAAGLSVQYQDLDFIDGKEETVRFSYRAMARFGAGFHSYRWTFGVSAYVDFERYPLGRETDILNNMGKLYARIGYKLDVPRWGRRYSKKLDEYQEKIEEALPENK